MVARQAAREMIHAAPEADLILLGDLIDRGPESAGCLQISQGIAAKPVAPFKRCTTLKGNHEIFLQVVLEGRSHSLSDDLSDWLYNGGAAAARSWGVDAQDKPMWPLYDELKVAIPQAIQDHLRALPSHVRIGNVIFVHAGVPPLGDVDKHLSEAWDAIHWNHWAWIREPFLSWSGGPLPDPRQEEDHGLVIVHGHSVASPTIRPHRIGVDTGAYESGLLTGIQIIGDRGRFLHVQAPS